MNIHFVSLGCDKNLVDSEKMLSLLLHKYPDSSIVEEPGEADVILVNTCSFIGDAKEESINTIIEMGSYKEKGRLKALMVTGCLAERYRDDILRELPEVDEVVGVKDYVDSLDVQLSRIASSNVHTSYLKIAEGCDKNCTYCIIPSLRGHYRSVPMEHLVKEAEALASQGTKELILVAQETTLYGLDLYGEKSLHLLLKRLARIEGIEWIRILYCYPEEIDDALIETIKTEPKVLHYLDIPIQHASDEVLRRMNRRTREEELREKIAHLRREIPDIALRTTLITGFPGEKKADFERLKRFVKEMRFERLGVFPYSQEENTPAAEMRPQVAQKTKEARRDEIMALQQGIAFEKATEKIGSSMRVMVEGYIPEEQVYVCRSYMDAPNIDGFVFVDAGGSRSLMSGDMINVRITASHEYDLIGEML